MKAEVIGQLKKFWLAYPEQWVELYGHEIKVGKYRFSAGSTAQGILISEVTTGMRVTTLPFNAITAVMGATREGTLDYYEAFVLPMLVDVVKKNKMDKVLDQARKNIEKLGIGKMPPIENVDDNIIREPISEILS